MTRVVYSPPTGHDCGPNRYGYWPANMFGQPGTVRECETCGKTWVAWHDRLDVGYMGVKWRRESRIARWWRERRHR